MLLDRPTREELHELDYLQLQRLLADVLAEILDILDELPKITGRFKELKAQLEILKAIKQIAQSLLRAQNA